MNYHYTELQKLLDKLFHNYEMIASIYCHKYLPSKKLVEVTESIENILKSCFIDYYDQLFLWASSNYKTQCNPNQITNYLSKLPKHILQNPPANLQNEDFAPNFIFFKRQLEKLIETQKTKNNL